MNEIDENYNEKCLECESFKKSFLKQYPNKIGTFLCDNCYEKSKEYICYLHLEYDRK